MEGDATGLAIGRKLGLGEDHLRLAGDAKIAPAVANIEMLLPGADDAALADASAGTQPALA